LDVKQSTKWFQGGILGGTKWSKVQSEAKWSKVQSDFKGEFLVLKSRFLAKKKVINY